MHKSKHKNISTWSSSKWSQLQLLFVNQLSFDVLKRGKGKTYFSRISLKYVEKYVPKGIVPDLGHICETNSFFQTNPIYKKVIAQLV